MISLILSAAFELTGLFQLIVNRNLQLGLCLLFIGALYEIAWSIVKRFTILTGAIKELNETLKSFKNKEVI